MPGYVRHIWETVNFDGQQVSVKLKPLLYADLLALRKGGEDNSAALLEYARILPRYVEEMSPILDSDAQPVELTTIAEAAYFTPLVAAIMKKHLEVTFAAQTPTSGGQSEG